MCKRDAVPPPTYRDWGPADLDMCNDYGGLATCEAHLTRGQARWFFAREWDCDFTDVRVYRLRLIWAPLQAARRYRDDHCGCDGKLVRS